jgi:hypothetical protein
MIQVTGEKSKEDPTMIFSRVVFRILKSDINRSTGKPPSVTKRIAPPKEFYTDKKLSVALMGVAHNKVGLNEITF